jgi:collagenase-like PrtC family protease
MTAAMTRPRDCGTMRSAKTAIARNADAVAFGNPRRGLKGRDR